MMRHELAHYQRYDVWKSLLAHLAALPHWFNPIAWLAVQRIEMCSEWACDDIVSRTGRDWSTNHAKALLMIGELACQQPAWTAAASGGRLSMRIRRILLPGIK